MKECGQAISGPANDDVCIERDILALLMGGGHVGLWAIYELQRELGDKLAVTDALERLERSGSVHRCGEFVLITRAAMRALSLADF